MTIARTAATPKNELPTAACHRATAMPKYPAELRQGLLPVAPQAI
jgi:hypothetical protein